jgi:hypothetical protein
MDTSSTGARVDWPHPAPAGRGFVLIVAAASIDPSEEDRAFGARTS